MSKALLLGFGAAAVALLAGCGANQPPSRPTAAGTKPSSDSYCALLRSSGGGAGLPSGLDAASSPQAIRQVYEQAARDMRSALAVAPSEIRADVAVVSASLDRLTAVLDRFGFDDARLARSPDALDGIDTPEFEAAAQRVEAYGRAVCGS